MPGRRAPSRPPRSPKSRPMRRRSNTTTRAIIAAPAASRATENKTDANPDMGLAIDFINAASGDDRRSRQSAISNMPALSLGPGRLGRPTLEPPRTASRSRTAASRAGMKAAEAWRDALATGLSRAAAFSRKVITRASRWAKTSPCRHAFPPRRDGRPARHRRGRLQSEQGRQFSAEERCLRPSAVAQLIAKSGVADAGALEVAAHRAARRETVSPIRTPTALRAAR